MLLCVKKNHSPRAGDGSFYLIFLRRFGNLLFTTSSHKSDFSWSAATHMVEKVAGPTAESPNLT